MVLCEIMEASGEAMGFVEVWLALTVLSWISLLLTSGVPFYYLYMRPTWETWQYKTNKKFPPPHMVRSEAYYSMRGVPFVTLSPTLALYMTKHGMGHAYCGFGSRGGWPQEIAQALVVWILTDFFEWGWHNISHRFTVLWNIHRYHHHYPNPTPFAVIADLAEDEIVRGSPLFWIPMLMPTNIDALFGVFLFFNFWGTFIHTGYDFVTPHQPFLNVPYHHHLHHAISTKNKPLHTGFYLPWWDTITGSVYKGECFCAQCDMAKGNRTPKHFEQVAKPDYSVLADWRYWWYWPEPEKGSQDKADEAEFKTE